jgi:hypothetical protein
VSDIRQVKKEWRKFASRKKTAHNTRARVEGKVRATGLVKVAQLQQGKKGESSIRLCRRFDRRKKRIITRARRKQRKSNENRERTKNKLVI